MSTTPNVILEGIVGSQAYGLATPESDVDRLGVYVAPTRDVLGLRGRTVTDQSIVTHNPDRTLHEVGKMLALALNNGNPTVMELLWLESWETCTAIGQRVVDLRRAVLSTGRVRGAYCGYAVQQARKLQRRSAEGKTGFAADLGRRTEKHGRHCFRFLPVSSFLTTGHLRLDMSDRRQEIFGYGRLAARDPERFSALFEGHRERFNRLDSVLPDKPDVDRVNTALVDIRRRFL